MPIFHRSIIFTLFLLFYGSALPSPSPAHALKIFATTDGQTITGSVYFRRGAPLVGTPVNAYTLDGELLSTAITGNDGRFTMKASGEHEHRLVAETVDGHRAELMLPAARLAPSRQTDNLPEEISGREVIPPRGSPEEGEPLALLIEQAVARQLLPLQEQLDRHDQRLRIQDAVAGLGYILGIAGLALFWTARKQRGRKEGKDGQ
jgi:nickel transport protein